MDQHSYERLSLRLCISIRLLALPDRVLVSRGLLRVLPTVEAQIACFVALERARRMPLKALRVFAVVEVYRDPFPVCAFIMHGSEMSSQDLQRISIVILGDEETRGVPIEDARFTKKVLQVGTSHRHVSIYAICRLPLFAIAMPGHMSASSTTIHCPIYVVSLYTIYSCVTAAMVCAWS